MAWTLDAIRMDMISTYKMIQINTNKYSKMALSPCYSKSCFLDMVSIVPQRERWLFNEQLNNATSSLRLPQSRRGRQIAHSLCIGKPWEPCSTWIKRPNLGLIFAKWQDDGSFLSGLCFDWHLPIIYGGI